MLNASPCERDQTSPHPLVVWAVSQVLFGSVGMLDSHAGCWSQPLPPHTHTLGLPFQDSESRARLCSQSPCSAISSRLVENRADFPLARIPLSFLQVASLICPLPVPAWMASSWDVVVDSDSFCFSLYLLKPCPRLLPNVWIHKLRNSKVDINSNLSQACWRVSVISDFWRLRQEGTKF